MNNNAYATLPIPSYNTICEGMSTCLVTMEQCYNIKFCVKLRKSAGASMNMLKTVSGDECLLWTHVYHFVFSIQRKSRQLWRWTKSSRCIVVKLQQMQLSFDFRGLTFDSLNVGEQAWCWKRHYKGHFNGEFWQTKALCMFYITLINGKWKIPKWKHVKIFSEMANGEHSF